MIDTEEITSASSPLPSLPHKWVEKITSPKFTRRMTSFDPIVYMVFFDNIGLSG
jgi:hypothetical protein